MNCSETTAKLFTALIAAQADISNPAFDSKNPFFNSDYVSLDALMAHTRPIFAKHGLAIQQLTVGVGGVTTMVIHGSGEWISDTAYFAKEGDTAQQIGGGCTYGRRYGWATASGVVGEPDDDGNAASGKTTPKPAAHPTPAAPVARRPHTAIATKATNGDPLSVHVLNVTPESFIPNGKTEAMDRFIITLSDGAKFKIINQDMAALAARAKMTGRPVFYSTEQSGKYLNLTAMEFAPEPLGQAAPEPEGLPPVPTDDDLPF